MDPQQVLQFYAPLAGLLIFSFTLGILWQRVTALEKEANKEDDLRDRLIKLEVTSQANSDRLSEIKVSVEGVHREINELIRTAIHNTIPAVRISRTREKV